MMKNYLTKQIMTLLLLLFALFPIIGFAENSLKDNAQANDEHIVWVKTPINLWCP